MKYLDKEHRPQSNDPNFWDVWTGKEEREIDWRKVVNDWQGINPNEEDITTPIADENKTGIKDDEDLPF